MYSNPRLETPPPISRFRRPWSPDPYDPRPHTSFTGAGNDYTYDNVYDNSRYPGRREPSDVSIEALDLADYALALSRSDEHSHRPFTAYGMYPSSPSAVSRPLSHSSPTQSPLPARRLFSLPPASTAVHDDYDSIPSAQRTAELDTAHFPAFSRHWYESRSALPTTYPTPRSNSHVNLSLDTKSPKPSPFDPDFPTHLYHDAPFSPPPAYPYPYSSPPSSRDLGLVPWDAGPADSPPIDAALKAERVRMLEHEFSGAGKDAGDDEEHMIGSVDARGRLITAGPKKRLAARWIQVILALTAAVSSLYAALAIKPSVPPPPQGTPAAYTLYILSVLTFLFATYLFLFYPCCCARSKARDTAAAGYGGLVVLPAQNLADGKRKKDKRGKKGREGGDVQVNLIVDPSLFGPQRTHEDDDGSTDVTGSAVPGAAPRSRRRGVFAGLALEAQWRRERRWLQIAMAVDVFALVLWGAEFVGILLGRRCPPGAFDGWCDAYNVATAASCVLCLVFGFSVYCDIKDLHACSTSPRTRP